MADITINSASSGFLYREGQRAGIYWKTPLVGYCFDIDDAGDLNYYKTTDGGQTFTPGEVSGNVVVGFDTWADWNTPGNTGTKIHIAYFDSSGATDTIRYCYLDTATDTVGGDTAIANCGGDGTFYGVSFEHFAITITRTVGGNLHMAYRCADSTQAPTSESYLSANEGVTWSQDSTGPGNIKLFESTPAYDVALLFPSTEADSNDTWALYWDSTASEISLKVYDASEGKWATEASIASSMTQGGASYIQMDGAIRHSDGHLIAAAWNLVDNAAADLMVWDINGAASITAKTNVITNTAEYAQCSIFIDQSTDDIYVAYFGGTTWTADVHCLYKKSTDGGANWGDQTQISVTNDDLRWVSAGCMHPTLGGRFMPIWFNDDLDDVVTNYDNSVQVDGWVGNFWGVSVPSNIWGIEKWNVGNVCGVS